MLRLSNATVLAARGTRKPWEIGPKLLIGNGAGEGNRTLVFSLEGFRRLNTLNGRLDKSAPIASLNQTLFFALSKQAVSSPHLTLTAASPPLPHPREVRP